MSPKVVKKTPKNKTAARIRRRKVRELWAACFTEEEMADKLNVTMRTIERDKAVIREEMKDVLEPTSDSVGTIIVGYDKVIQGFVKQYHETSDERTRTAALRGAADTFEKKSRLMQSMGIIPKEADKIDIKAEVLTPDSLMVLLADVGRDLPDDARAKLFSRLRERMKPDE